MMNIKTELSSFGASAILGLLAAARLQERVLSSLVLDPPKTPSYSICSKTSKVEYVKRISEKRSLDSSVILKGFFVPTENGTVACVHLTSAQNSDEKLPIYLFAHGNSSDIGLSLRRLERLCQESCVSVVAFDYLGYGQSTGTPSIGNCILSVRAVFDWCLKKKIQENVSMIVHGHSFGAYLMMQLSSVEPFASHIDAVVLESPFATGLKAFFPNSKLRFFDCLQTEKAAATMEKPVLLIHARDDEVIDIRNSQDLARKCKSTRLNTWWPDHGGHCKIDVRNRHTFEQRIRDFIVTELPAANSC
eukprot:GHVP01066346.1.p1 GENE.GHVP01066346.1~~GHVP01066346.1.p1  ORF type:complete len:304 (+),score=48.46 GHVP01066346.1:51-962(+)